MTELEQKSLDQAKILYKTYPRHVAPAAALKAIAKAVKRLVETGELPDEYAARRWLWKKVKEYAVSPAGQKPPKGCEDYRPHPTTWFNGDRFFDDPAEWKKPNGVSRNGRNNGQAGKADRTLTAIQNVLHARTDTHLAGVGGSSTPAGCRTERNVSGRDDTAVIEGERY